MELDESSSGEGVSQPWVAEKVVDSAMGEKLAWAFG